MEDAASEDRPRRTRRAVQQQLESLRRAGVTHLRKPKARPRTAGAEAEGPQTTLAAAHTALNPPAAAGTTSGRAVATPAPADGESLAIVQREVAACIRCAELAGTRTQTVFGVGSPRARLCFVGEAPGADEDRQGEPFVGKAGQLLNRIIEACGMRRADIYICNVLKCRPPDNRTPEPTEIANCLGYLERQLALVAPEYIVCWGSVAARTVLGSEQTIGRLRGAFHDFRGTPVLCTYHPSYLLRNPAAKKDVWEDMKLLLAKMGLPIPSAG
jgi:uracil-DNA glycosylase